MTMSRGCNKVSRTIPPMSDSTCRANSEIWWLSTPCRSATSLVSRLANSPVRRSAKKPGDISSSLANSSRRSRGDDLLADDAQEIRLDVVQDRLDGKEHHQHDRDLVEQTAVGPHEGRVEEIPDRDGKGEPDDAAQHEREAWPIRVVRDAV